MFYLSKTYVFEVPTLPEREQIEPESEREHDRVDGSILERFLDRFGAPNVKLLGAFWEPIGRLFAINAAVGPEGGCDR